VGLQATAASEASSLRGPASRRNEGSYDEFVPDETLLDEADLRETCVVATRLANAFA